MSLIKQLRNFRGAETVDNLTVLFERLSHSFLYGGYYNIGGKYRIYIRTVEFYFHSEKSSDTSIKDPIVYHRNNRYVEGSVPYFPIMALHAHSSGFDITFENKNMQYRASALIRAYEVYDIDNHYFLEYDTKVTKFIPCKGNKNRINTQSTYLYNFLNGFEKDNIKWNDESTFQVKEIAQKARKNIYKSKSQIDYIPEIDSSTGQKIKDERKWSFSRMDKTVISITDDNLI